MIYLCYLYVYVFRKYFFKIVENIFFGYIYSEITVLSRNFYKYKYLLWILMFFFYFLVDQEIQNYIFFLGEDRYFQGFYLKWSFFMINYFVVIVVGKFIDIFFFLKFVKFIFLFVVVVFRFEILIKILFVFILDLEL